MNKEQYVALAHLRNVLSYATTVGLLDLLGCNSHPTIVNDFCDAVEVLALLPIED